MKIHLRALFCDIVLLALAFVVITGGYHFVSGDLKLLVDQKPWTHRLVLTLITLLMFSFAFVQYHLTIKKGIGISLALPFIKGMNISYKAWVWILFFLYSSLMFVSSMVRHEAFRTSFDMAIFTQSIWATLQGDFLFSSIKGGICLLADHFSPILAMLVLPYAVWSSPLCLLMIQSLVVCACVFPIYKIAQHVLKDNFISLIFVISFILYLPTRNSIRFDFHPELLVMPILLWAFYLLTLGKKWWSSLLLLLAITGKENVPIVTFGIGLYALLFRSKSKLFGLFWMLFSVVYFFAVTKLVVPLISGEEYFYLRGNFDEWKNLGVSAFLQHLFRKESFVYLIKIFGPLGFTSFLNPFTLLMALPMLAQNLIARNEMTLSIFFQYTALLTPFVFISAIYGVRKIPKKWSVVLILLSAILFMGVSEVYTVRRYYHEWHENRALVKKYTQLIPSEDSVRTHEVFATHFAHRKHLHVYENNHPKEGGRALARNSKWVVIDESLLDDVEGHTNELLGNGYEVYFEQNGFWVLKK